jgi:hypothetical protein
MQADKVFLEAFGKPSGEVYSHHRSTVDADTEVADNYTESERAKGRRKKIDPFAEFVVGKSPASDGLGEGLGMTSQGLRSISVDLELIEGKAVNVFEGEDKRFVVVHTERVPETNMGTVADLMTVEVFEMWDVVTAVAATMNSAAGAGGYRLDPLMVARSVHSALLSLQTGSLDSQ